MTEIIEIRESERADIPLIEALYPKAFPEEDLLPLVGELLEDASTVLSLIATVKEIPVGHIVFTTCDVEEKTSKVALLGPLAVAPDHQRRGIGSMLINEGLALLKNEGMDRVFVLGDPAYYGRFGFEPEENLMPPYPLPDEWCGAWRSLSLDRKKTPLRGKLIVPPPWRQEILWVS